MGRRITQVERKRAIKGQFPKNERRNPFFEYFKFFILIFIESGFSTSEVV
jgi:hypothetical protein